MNLEENKMNFEGNNNEFKMNLEENKMNFEGKTMNLK